MAETKSFRIPTTRLSTRNYDEGGFYFVTICVQQMECVFGQVSAGETKLSRLGNIAQERWLDIPNHHEGVRLDDFVVMPNHLHGILQLPQTNWRDNQKKLNRFQSPAAGTLGSIIRSFKSAVTKEANERGLSFQWQPRYWDHVIRNNQALAAIREYIWQNPLNWGWDSQNPSVAHLYDG